MSAIHLDARQIDGAEAITTLSTIGIEPVIRVLHGDARYCAAVSNLKRIGDVANIADG